MRLKDIPEYFDTTGKRTVPDLTSDGWNIVQWGTEYHDDHKRYPGTSPLSAEIERTEIGKGWLNKYAGERGLDWELYGLWLWIIRDPNIARRFKEELNGPLEC
jgi:hypothetical protein